MEKLTSLKIQNVINMKTFDDELWTIVLRFGKRKKGQFRFPIVFKNQKQLNKLYIELYELIGYSLKEVKELCNPIYEKYKKYHYLK